MYALLLESSQDGVKVGMHIPISLWVHRNESHDSDFARFAMFADNITCILRNG